MRAKAALRKMFPADQYALFYEVRNSTGFAANRSADAMAFGLWPSRGMPVIGFEFKASRSDWLREMKDPAKAESIMRFCDHWYLLTTQPDIVKPGELPTTWGHMEWRADTDKLKVLAVPPKLEAQPLSRLFVAAICRAAQEHSPAETMIAAAVAAARKEWESAKERVRRDHSHIVQNEYDTLRKQLDEFEKASGVALRHQWRYADIGKAVKLVLDGKIGVAAEVASAVRNLELAIEIVRELADIPSLARAIELPADAAVLPARAYHDAHLPPPLDEL